MKTAEKSLCISSILGGALFSAVALLQGCSVIFRAEAAQCSTNGDCTARGPSFANTFCSAGTCKPNPVPDGGVDAGKDATVVMEASVDAGMEAEAEAGFRCTSNADCPVDAVHPKVMCDVGSGQCLQLQTDECPVVLGDISGDRAAPILVGAFATIPLATPDQHPSTLNYGLAIDEFGTQGGVPGWDPVRNMPGFRMPVAVVCNAEADVHVAMTHLVSDLHVPAVVAALDSVSLKTMFVNDALPNNVFVVNPFGADSTLTGLSPGTVMLWHMLGQPRDNAPAYAGVMPRIEALLRSRGLTGPLRVAVVTANATVTLDLANAAQAVMTWNGVTVGQNQTDGNFLSVGIDSILNGVSQNDINVDSQVTALLNFQPHVVVSFASAEFVKLLQNYEIQLAQAGNTTKPKPFYLVGPYNMESQSLLAWIGPNGSVGEAKRTRVAGVGVAAASDTHVLDAYKIRFLNKYINGSSALGQENYYDAMYFAVYSVVGAGRLSTIGGTNVAQGMLRLLAGAPSYDMGPADMGTITNVLNAPNSNFGLFGTLGPPTFTLSTGARIGEGSIYCVARNQSSGVTSYAYDVLRVTPAADGGTPDLGGTFPCYSGF